CVIWIPSDPNSFAQFICTSCENRMSLASTMTVGTIRLEPSRPRLAKATACDDSTLDSLLVSLLSHHPLRASATDSGQRFRLTASDRLIRLGLCRFDQTDLRANLAQLRDDLQAEYDRLEGRVAG